MWLAVPHMVPALSRSAWVTLVWHANSDHYIFYIARASSLVCPSSYGSILSAQQHGAHGDAVGVGVEAAAADTWASAQSEASLVLKELNQPEKESRTGC